MRDLRAIIFDFDLTLVDSRLGFVDAHEYARTRLSLPEIAAEAAVRTIGTPLPDAFRLLYPGHEMAMEEYMALWQARADEAMTGLTSVLPGVPQAVRALHAAGMALGIVSQKRRYRIEAVLEREGLLDCFAAVVGGDDAPEFKPDPSGILMVLRRMEATAERAVYVGDTVIDAEAASRAGLPFIAVLSGFATRDDFLVHQPLAVLESVADLPALLRERAGRTAADRRPS